MVIFNELRISEDRKCLIVDCEVENVDVYENMYIKSIYLDYYMNASAASMPSDKAYLLYENTNDDKTVRAKRIKMSSSMLPLTDFGTTTLEDGLFYVIVTCDGDLPASVSSMPCGYDETTNIGAIVDWKSFYTRGMQFVSALYNGCSGGKFCESPVGFEDFIVVWNAMKLAISTCNWDLVTTLWHRFLRTPAVAGSGYVTGGCGCG